MPKRSQSDVEVASGISGFLSGLSGQLSANRKRSDALKLARAQKQPKPQETVDFRTAAAFLRSVGQEEEAKRVEDEGLPQNLNTLKLFQPSLSPITRAGLDPVKEQKDRELRKELEDKKNQIKQQEADTKAAEVVRKKKRDALAEVQRKFFSEIGIINENELLRTGSDQDIADYNEAIKRANINQGLEPGPDRIGNREGEKGFFSGKVFGEAPTEYFINPASEVFLVSGQPSAPAAAPTGGQATAGALQDTRLNGVRPEQLERAKKIVAALDKMPANDPRRAAFEAALQATKQ